MKMIFKDLISFPSNGFIRDIRKINGDGSLYLIAFAEIPIVGLNNIDRL